MFVRMFAKREINGAQFMSFRLSSLSYASRPRRFPTSTIFQRVEISLSSDTCLNDWYTTSCVLSWNTHSVVVSAFTATISLANSGRLSAQPSLYAPTSTRARNRSRSSGSRTRRSQSSSSTGAAAARERATCTSAPTACGSSSLRSTAASTCGSGPSSRLPRASAAPNHPRRCSTTDPSRSAPATSSISQKTCSFRSCRAASAS